MAIIWNTDRHELWIDGTKQFELAPANYKPIKNTKPEDIELIIKTATDLSLSGYHIFVHLFNSSPAGSDTTGDRIRCHRGLKINN